MVRSEPAFCSASRHDCAARGTSTSPAPEEAAAATAVGTAVWSLMLDGDGGCMRGTARMGRGEEAVAAAAAAAGGGERGAAECDARRADRGAGLIVAAAAGLAGENVLVGMAERSSVVSLKR